MKISYKRPPITEAVIEFRFAKPSSKDAVDKCVRRLKTQYFYEDTDDGLDVRVDPSARTTQFKAAWEGTKLSSIDRTDITIFRTTSFVCSRLAPYPGWDHFRQRAERDWQEWRKVAGVQQIARVGLRYINRIDVPVPPVAPFLKVESYLKVWPEFPDSGLPLKSYAMQIARPLGTDDCWLTINSGSITSPLVGCVSLGLDLDVFRDANVPMGNDLWTLVDRMREHKNLIFESCITDLSRKLFDQ